MPEGIDDAANAFANEIAPASRPRDQAGKFVATTSKPEPMFAPRPIEADPTTGDTRDGGDNKQLRAREQQIADGREPDDTEVEDVELEPENVGALGEPEPEPDDEPVDDGGEKYEVTIDGTTHQVTLREALNGYIRQETFHQRMQAAEQRTRENEQDANNLRQAWQWWHKARTDYEEDLAALIPPEPNWDQEFARDPQAAHAQQKIFGTLYGKLNQSRQMRALREKTDAEENDRRVQKYAVDGFTKFVMDNIKDLPDEPTLKRNVQSMRRTAMAQGFSEYEVATVYDPRMLTILLKASKYDRMQANRPRPVIPGKGKTLAPGAATPLSGNARRSGIDDAQRQLARTGKLQDAVDVFQRIIR